MSMQSYRLQAGSFIDFMLTEIRNALVKHKIAEKATDKVPDNAPNKVPDKVPNKSVVDVIGLLLKFPGITAVEMASEIGITDRAVRKIIRSLKQQGVVERIGSNKSGYWKVKRRHGD